MNPKRLLAITRAGIMESLQFRLGIFVTLFANLIYLVLVYYLWKAIYDSSGTDVVNGMTFTDTMIYLILATALFNFLEMFVVWDMSRKIQSGALVLDLLKPMRFRKYTFWSYTGNHVVQFVLTFIPTFIVVMIVTGGAIPLGLNIVWFIIALPGEGEDGGTVSAVPRGIRHTAVDTSRQERIGHMGRTCPAVRAADRVDGRADRSRQLILELCGAQGHRERRLICIKED